MSFKVLIPFSNHFFFKLIFRLGLNQIGISCIISIWTIISVLNKASKHLMKSSQNGLYMTSLITSSLSGPKVKASYIPKKLGETVHFESLLSSLLAHPNFKAKSNFSKLCTFKPPSIISASIISLRNFGGLLFQRNFLNMELISSKRLLLGLGRDRSRWVIFERKSDLMTVTLPYGHYFRACQSLMSFFM